MVAPFTVNFLYCGATLKAFPMYLVMLPFKTFLLRMFICDSVSGGSSCLPKQKSHRHTQTSCSTVSPVCAAVSALRVSEVRLQEHVLIDSSHQAVDV